MRRLALLVGVAVVSAACLGSDFADSVEGSWQLVSGTVDGEQIPILESHPVTLTLAGGEAGGTASCNGYGGVYDLDGSTITFSETHATAMACIPGETMVAETLYLEGLIRVSGVGIDEGMTLSGEGVSLVFESLPPVPEAELTGTVWVLDGLVTGDTVTSVDGEPATLELFTDGSVLGSTGCRTLAGQYVVDGPQVLFTELAANGECEPGLAAQDL